MDKSAEEKLKSFFDKVQLSEKEEGLFFSLWELKHFGQNQLIMEAGKVEHYFYYVLEGVQVLYILNRKGEKVVLGFSYSGSPSGVFDSFVFQSPSSTFLETLKPSQMLAIRRSNYQRLFEIWPDFHVWGHHFFRDILLGRLYREVELLTLTAKERYMEFMQRCPEELKVIPQKYLASYLNMKPETYSRLRRSTLS
ncbi:MAG: Crp/Fnr family transcriptional regulator [Bacteroidota bacterium]